MNGAEENEIWGPYVCYDDVARFTYGRRLWRQPEMRRRLLKHWLDERHPYRDRFVARRQIVEDILSTDEPPVAVDRRLRKQGASLRSVVREIPPIFGGFF
jgi:hypothetical protein